MLLLTCFSYNCNLFKHVFCFVFLNSFVHSHATVMYVSKQFLRTKRYCTIFSSFTHSHLKRRNLQTLSQEVQLGYRPCLCMKWSSTPACPGRRHYLWFCQLSVCCDVADREDLTAAWWPWWSSAAWLQPLNPGISSLRPPAVWSQRVAVHLLLRAS